MLRRVLIGVVLLVLLGNQGVALAAVELSQQSPGVGNDSTLFINQGDAIIAVSLSTGAQQSFQPPYGRIVRADVSSDGSKIVVHTGGPNEPGHLFVLHTDGSAAEQLTEFENSVLEVFFGPSGDVVYFDEISRDIRSAVIASIDISTGARVEHTPAGLDAELIGVRGDRLAYFESGVTRSLVVKDLSTGQELVRSSAGELQNWAMGQGSINDSGSRILFANDDGLSVLDLDDAEPIALVDSIGALWPRLSPDGRWVAYSAAAGDEEALTLVDLNDPTSKTVLVTAERVVNPGWTPDSSGIVFAEPSPSGLSSVYVDLSGTATSLGIDGIPFRMRSGFEVRALAVEPREEEPALEAAAPVEEAAIEAEPDENDAPAVDTDGDGISDRADSDDDNDGHPDSEDAFPLNRYEWQDSDGDGIGDEAEQSAYWRAWDFIRDTEDSDLDDADGDGKWDPSTDEDGDGYHDLIDPNPSRPPLEACVFENPELLEFSSTQEEDWDGDGVPNSSDQDLNNDGVVEEWELAELAWATGDGDQDGDGVVDREDLDADGDGVPNSEDQFPLDPSEWVDFDCGGLGDNSDPDDDDDGVLEAEEGYPNERIDPFPRNDHEWSDSDEDGIGDNLDADDDNDGTLDSSDFFPTDPTETLDSDHDGVGNNADPDDDNDGVLDEDDAFPTDYLYSRDADGDGEGDFSELRQNNPELVAIIDDVLGNGDALSYTSGSSSFSSQRSSRSEGSGVPWRIIRLFVVWPLIFFGVRKGRENA